MSKEMIDRNLFVQSINESIAEAHKWGASAQDDEIKIRAEQAISTFCEASLRAKQMPAIDAVEVVRCKDCIHCSKENCLTENGIVTLNSCWNHLGIFTYLLDNDYCSRGYRRDNDDTNIDEQKEDLEE